MAVKKKVTKKRPVGRPTKISKEITEKIVNAILIGAYIETAAAHAGLNKDTFYAWLKAGARDRDKGLKNQFVEFSDAIGQAMADCELRDLSVIDSCANGEPEPVYNKEGEKIGERIKKDWRAAAFRLERKFPVKWGKRQSIHVDDKPVQEQETYEQYIERINKE